jgi:hypothetical protein
VCVFFLIQIDVCGEALSHVVGLTTEDLLEITTQPAANISLLLNCTSIVSQFYEPTIKSVEVLMDRGVRMRIVDENQKLCEKRNIDEVKKVIARHPAHSLERMTLEARESGSNKAPAHDVCMFENVVCENDIRSCVPDRGRVQINAQLYEVRGHVKALNDFFSGVSVGTSYRDLEVVTSLACLTDLESRAKYLRKVAHSKVAVLFVSEGTISSISQLGPADVISESLEETLTDWICALVCRHISDQERNIMSCTGKRVDVSTGTDTDFRPECKRELREFGCESTNNIVSTNEECVESISQANLFRNFVGCSDSDNVPFVSANSADRNTAYIERNQHLIKNRTGSIDCADAPSTPHVSRFGRAQSARSLQTGSQTPGGTQNVVCSHECVPSLQMIVPYVMLIEKPETPSLLNAATCTDDELFSPDVVSVPDWDSPARSPCSPINSRQRDRLSPFFSPMSNEMLVRLSNIRPENAIRIAILILREHMYVKSLAKETSSSNVDERSIQISASVWKYLSHLSVLDIVCGIFEHAVSPAPATVTSKKTLECSATYSTIIPKLKLALNQEIHRDDKPNSVELSELSCDELATLFINSGLDECVAVLVAKAATGRSLVETFESVVVSKDENCSKSSAKFEEFFGSLVHFKLFCALLRQWSGPGIRQATPLITVNDV